MGKPNEQRLRPPFLQGKVKVFRLFIEKKKTRGRGEMFQVYINTMHTRGKGFLAIIMLEWIT